MIGYRVHGFGQIREELEQSCDKVVGGGGRVLAQVVAHVDGTQAVVARVVVAHVVGAQVVDARVMVAHVEVVGRYVSAQVVREQPTVVDCSGTSRSFSWISKPGTFAISWALRQTERATRTKVRGVAVGEEPDDGVFTAVVGHRGQPKGRPDATGFASFRVRPSFERR